MTTDQAHPDRLFQIERFGFWPAALRWLDRQPSVDRSATETTKWYEGMPGGKAGHPDGLNTKNREER
jgi:hypothetical protein